MNGFPTDGLKTFCKRHHVRKLAVFGSAVARPTQARDIDVLIEFEPGYEVGLITLAALELELSELAGKQVDLRTPAELSRYFRDEVMQNAVVLYAA